MARMDFVFSAMLKNGLPEWVLSHQSGGMGGGSTQPVVGDDDADKIG